MKAVIGFLENMDFDEGAEKVANKYHVESTLVRKWMNEQLTGDFLSRRIPYVGPTASMHSPPGGYFFKLGLTREPKILKNFVLRKLGLRESLKLKSDAVGSYSIPLGILVKEYDIDENPGRLSFESENNAWDFASHLRAFTFLRKDEVTPYFKVVDESFYKEYPVSIF